MQRADFEEVLEAMEQAIQKAGRAKYGAEKDIRAVIAINSVLCARGYSAPKAEVYDLAQGFAVMEDLGHDIEEAAATYSIDPARIGLIGHSAMYGPQAAFFSELFGTRVGGVAQVRGHYPDAYILCVPGARVTR